MRKDLFNYAERLDRQLVAMLYNPKFSYVWGALYDLMQSKGVFTEHFGKKKIYAPGDEERFSDSTESPYVDLNTYNELMQAAKLFALVGKTPREISLLNISSLNGAKTEYKVFTDEDFDKIGDPVDDEDEREYYLVWLYVGNNREIYMPALVCCEDGTVVMCLDEKIGSDYGDTDQLPKKKLDISNFVDGYEYISGMFDYLYDPSEDLWDMKEFDNFLDDFSDEDEVDEPEEEHDESEEVSDEIEEDDFEESDEDEFEIFDEEDYEEFDEEDDDEDDVFSNTYEEFDLEDDDDENSEEE